MSKMTHQAFCLPRMFFFSPIFISLSVKRINEFSICRSTEIWKYMLTTVKIYLWLHQFPYNFSFQLSSGLIKLQNQSLWKNTKIAIELQSFTPFHIVCSLKYGFPSFLKLLFPNSEQISTFSFISAFEENLFSSF